MDMQQSFGKIIGDAVVRALSKSDRAQLVKDFAKQLCTRPSSYQKDPLSEALHAAMQDYAQEACREWLADNPEFKEKMFRILGEGMERMLTKERGALEERLDKALRDAFCARDY